MNRRRFFGLMAAAPMAAKTVAESAAADLARLKVSGLVDGGSISGGGIYGTPMPAQGAVGDPRAMLKRALLDPKKRAEIESLLFERYTAVGAIDPDIACYRSFSLNAKITFQRQRNVERALQEELGEATWQRWHELYRKVTGWLS
jgi:hypothetical protein